MDPWQILFIYVFFFVDNGDYFLFWNKVWLWFCDYCWTSWGPPRAAKGSFLTLLLCNSGIRGQPVLPPASQTSIHAFPAIPLLEAIYETFCKAESSSSLNKHGPSQANQYPVHTQTHTLSHLISRCSCAAQMSVCDWFLCLLLGQQSVSNYPLVSHRHMEQLVQANNAWNAHTDALRDSRLDWMAWEGKGRRKNGNVRQKFGFSKPCRPPSRCYFERGRIKRWTRTWGEKEQDALSHCDRIFYEAQ